MFADQNQQHHLRQQQHQQQQQQQLQQKQHEQHHLKNNKNNNNNNKSGSLKNQCSQNSNFRKILCNENLVLVDSEEEVEEVDDQDSDGSANSAVFTGSSVSVNNQRRKGLKRTFLTSTPSSSASGTLTSYKRHFHEGRLLNERLILGELFLVF